MANQNQALESPTMKTQSEISEDDELRALLAIEADARAKLGDVDEAQAKTQKALSVSASRMLQNNVNDPSADELERQAKIEEACRRQDRWNRLIDKIGKRYAECRRGNFRISDDPAIAAKQKAAIASLEKLTANFKAHLKAGGNLILYGPPGTGKDHLMVSLIRFAIFGGCEVDWCNGQDLFGDFRDRIDSAGTEMDLIRRYVRPEILAISDPIQPKGEASAYATSMLYRIIDGRYRQQKPTWFTLNVASAAEGEQQISGPVFDRMRDNAVAVFCNWPSYRQSNKPEWMK